MIIAFIIIFVSSDNYILAKLSEVLKSVIDCDGAKLILDPIGDPSEVSYVCMKHFCSNNLARGVSLSFIKGF